MTNVTCSWCGTEVPQNMRGRHGSHTADGALVVLRDQLPCFGVGLVNPPEGQPVPVVWVALAPCGCVRSVAYLYAYPSRRQAARGMGCTDGRTLLVCVSEQGHAAVCRSLKTPRGTHHHPRIQHLPHPLDGEL